MKQSSLVGWALGLGLIAASPSVLAGGDACVTVNSGSWNNGAVWSCDSAPVPNATHSATIAAGHTVTLSTNATVRFVVVEPGGDLNVGFSAQGSTLSWNEPGGDLSNASIDLLADLTINVFGAGSADLIIGSVNGASDLALNSDGLTILSGTIGNNTPLASVTTDSFGMTRIDGVEVAANSVVINDPLEISGAATTTGNLTALHNELFANSTDDTLTVNGNAQFFSSSGASDPIDQLFVSGTSFFNVPGGGTIRTRRAQTFQGQITMASDITLEATVGGLMTLGDITGNSHLTINNSQNTDFVGDTIDPFPQSITTDPTGNTRLRSGTQLTVNGSSATTFGDSVQVGPATIATIEQLGGGNIVFSASIGQFSGGPHGLVVNDVSGQTIFEGDINVGALTTNDGAGADSTIFATGLVNMQQSGASTGDLILNDPVFVDQSVIFRETNGGSLQFLNDLNVVPVRNRTTSGGVNITFESDAPISLASIGNIAAPASVLAGNGGEIQLNGDVSVDDSIEFPDNPVVLNTDVSLTSSGAGNIILSEVNSQPSENNALMVTTAGTTQLQGRIGVSDPLSSLVTDAAGLTLINTSGPMGGGEWSIETTTAQTYNDPVQAMDTHLRSIGALTFNNTLNAGDPGVDVTLDAGSTLALNDQVGNITPLQGLSYLATTAQLNTDLIQVGVGGLNDGGSGAVLGQSLQVLGNQISFQGPIGLGSHTLTFSPSVLASASATISGTGAVIKTGSGVLDLSGSNSYSGMTTLNNGTLRINGTLSMASAVMANAGVLEGVGAAQGPVVVNSATLAPGNSPGALSTGSVLLDVGSTLALEIDGPNAGADFDQLLVSGTVTLNDSQLLLSGAYRPTGQGNSFVVIDNDGADPVLGTFIGISEGGMATLKVPVRVTYSGGDGNDVVLVDDETPFFDGFESPSP